MTPSTGPAPLPRVGTGVDVHRLVEGRPLWVAGLHWPDEPRGLEGHSDADVVCHAVCDALLAASGLGDLGSTIGTSDSRWAGASGVDILGEVVRLVRADGWTVGNVSVQLVGPVPRLGARRSEASDLLSATVGADVSLTATTTDGLGLVGRGEGLAAVSTALVAR